MRAKLFSPQQVGRSLLDKIEFACLSVTYSLQTHTKYLRNNKSFVVCGIGCREAGMVHHRFIVFHQSTIFILDDSMVTTYSMSHSENPFTYQLCNHAITEP